MTAEKIQINRAPVMTLWAATVAEHMGFDHETALTLAKVVTGLNAQAKGQRLGIFEPKTKEHVEQLRQRPVGDAFSIALLGREVPVAMTDAGLRATQDGKPLSVASVEAYLAKAFAGNLGEAQAAMDDLAAAFTREDLADQAYHLYEKFRPSVPPGVKGWGAKGELDLDQIRTLAKAH